MENFLQMLVHSTFLIWWISIDLPFREEERKHFSVCPAVLERECMTFIITQYKRVQFPIVFIRCPEFPMHKETKSIISSFL